MSRRRRRLERQRSELEARCASLVNDAVVRVRYVGYVEAIDGAEGDYDSLDHGLELTTGSGRTIGLMWDYAIVDFGIALVDGPIPVSEETPRVDVTTTSRWNSLTGRAITACRPLWKPDEDEQHIDALPQTIQLDFEGDRRVLVTASDFDSDFMWGADHVSVFFDDAWERRPDLTAGLHTSLN